MPLGPDHARHVAVQHLEDLFRHEGLARAVDIAGHAVFLGFRNVIGKTIKLLGPHRMRMRLFEIKEVGVEDRVGGHVRMVRLDDAGVGVEAADDLARGIGALRARVVGLVQDHHIGKLDLVGQQGDQRALVLVAHDLAPVLQEVVA